MSSQKHKYTQPSIKVIYIDTLLAILADSGDEWDNESPIGGGSIGDDE